MEPLNDWKKYAPKPRELSGGDQWNVFLSYRSVNRSWVLNLYDVLREEGHKVFLDQCEIMASDSLTRRLEGALGSSQVGVLIWSAAAQDSEWVRREYEVMERQVSDKKGFLFIPVRLDRTPLPPFARNRVFLDFSDYPDGPNGGELLRLLHAVVGKPLSNEAVRFANSQDDMSKQAITQINAAIMNGRPDLLIQLFREGGPIWETYAGLGCKAAEGLTRLKYYDDAITILTDLEQRFHRAVRPKQLHALALARRGLNNDLNDAQDILGQLYQSGQKDPETLGIYARTWMDRYAKSGKVSDLRRSRNLYAEAFEGAQDDYYTGINAAAKSVFLGSEEDLKMAADYAEQVQTIVGTEPRPGDYWMTATVAEVFLIQKKYKEAAQRYQEAVDMATEEKGSHESTWIQAQRLMEKLQPTDQERRMISKVFAE